MVKAASIETIEKLEKQIAEKKRRIALEKALLTQKSKRNYKRRLFQVGALAEKAGVLEVEDALLLGAFLTLAILPAQSERYLELKAKGEEFLEDERQKKEPPQAKSKHAG